MAKITRIKAGDSSGDKKQNAETALTRKKVVIEDKKTKKAKIKARKKAEKSIGASSSKTKKTFILFRPFVALGRYLRDAWRELRQVRWPNAKATWKMVLAVFVYTILFMVVIFLLDLFFSWLFNAILGKG